MSLASTLILATKVMPERSAKPRRMRFALVASLMSSGSRPSALSIIARSVLLVIFAPIETPFSSSLPPETVRVCQNFRRMCGPSATVNSAVEHQHVAALGAPERFRRPRSISLSPSMPPGRRVIVTLAKVPSGIRSPVFCGSASFMSKVMGVILWRWR